MAPDEARFLEDEAAGSAASVENDAAWDVRRTPGFLVVDVRRRPVGHVVGPMFGSSPDTPDALSVSFGHFGGHRRRLVPTNVIEAIDHTTRMIGLHVERETIRRFL